MDKKALVIFLICLAALLASFGYAIATNYSGYTIHIPLTIIVLGFFLSGILFFGFLAFIPAIFYGLSIGAEKNAAIVIYIFPIAIATYAGAKLGMLLFDDFQKKKYFIKELRGIIALLVLAVILSLVIEAALPIIIDLWPKDLFGLNVVKGQDVTDMISNLSKFIRN